MKKLLSLSILTASSLLAITPDVDAIQKSITVPNEVQQEKVPLIELSGKDKYVPVMKDDKSGKKILVKDFQIEGNTTISSDELKKEISSFSNQELNFRELQEITSIITKKYREKGLFVARAYIPVQDISKNDNVFKIAVIEGNYGEFKLTNCQTKC